ncbi:MAG: nickel-dependent hydrogenase large subunit [Anaerolineae bacterium]|nr:nickel-dependent hydrogenase large subunit [Anaerolineae bacterium]
MSDNPGNNKVFIPIVQSGNGSGSVPPGGPTVVIDPVTRIEGHLRIEVKVNNGAIEDAWSTGPMFRGLELILKGRDPRDAWVFTQRICGVCTTVHAIASVRAVENALGIAIPDNARILRNLIEGAQFVHDHVVHFYHLHALDWVDLMSALQADPAATSALALSLSDWHNSSPAYFQSVKTRLQNFVNSGQLGLFGNGYWGHPAYRLPPAGNLLAVAHYLEALEWQNQFIKFHAILGGKNPHPQTYLVGGMATPLDASSQAAITPARIADLRALVQLGLDFVNKVYLPDLMLIASYYTDWAGTGGGYGNFLSFGDFPGASGNSPANLWMPRGMVVNKNLGQAPQPVDQTLIQEYIAHSWYSYNGGDQAGKHPYQGETRMNYTGPQTSFSTLSGEERYSWLKAPRYNGMPMEVGPLARVVVAYAAGHARIRELTDWVLAQLQVGPDALFSTLGRIAARGIETLAIAEQMNTWLDELENNILNNNLTVQNNQRWNPSTWPADAWGYGMTEAPRGGLGHWVHIVNGKIENYQAVVPTTWNGSPRDAQNARGPWEQALVGVPVADASRPLEVLRTIHSFDPCMACAVHIVDPQSNQVMQIWVQH